MKFKIATVLFLVFFAFSFIGYSQVEPAEVPMFGNVKNLGGEDNATEEFTSNYTHDFGVVKGVPQTFRFTIKNTGQTNIDVVDIKLPALVGITIIDLHIKPGTEGAFMATVDPAIMKKGPFKTWFIVTTQQNDPGLSTTKEIFFVVSGIIK
jgi:hypothetical protein